MEEKKLNMFAKEEEYKLLRKYIQLVDGSEINGMAGAVRRALESELTGRQKQLIYMYYIEQMRMQDIADELGLHISTVSRTLKRGRERLKRSLRYGGRAFISASGE